MLPELIGVGGPWKVLPPGIHDSNLAEIESRFATNEHRKQLFEGFARGVEALRLAGCSTVYLNGSFVTEKETPGDFDACWERTGVDDRVLDPTLFDFANGRAAQKAKFRGEFFVSSTAADNTNTFRDFFQKDRYTGRQKGIVRISLS